MRLRNNATHGVALLAIVIAGGVGACASTSTLTRNDVIRQYDELAQLEVGLTHARSQNAEVLAPDQFEKTEALLETAVERAREADKAGANQTAAKGLEELSTLDQMLDTNGRIMEEVMSTRLRAEEQGAAVLFEADFKQADEDLKKASRLLEKNDTEAAADERSSLIEAYAQLELRALKKGLAAAAAAALKTAEDADADDHAPKTLEQARQALKLANAVLEADRTQIEKSNRHAQDSIWLARRAQGITATAKQFEAQDFSPEDVLLWYQAQLQQVRQPIGSHTLPFDLPNDAVVAALRDDVIGLIRSTQDLREAHRLAQARIQMLEDELDEQAVSRSRELEELLEQHETQLAALKAGTVSKIKEAREVASSQIGILQAKLSAEATEREAQERREAESKARYENVRAMFSPEEAEVFREGDNVLIRLKGFQFRSGKWEIDSKNFALLNRVVTSINSFPGAKVAVRGHTDSMGSPEQNLSLSQKRATSVAEFLTTVGGVPADRVSSEGRGEEEPIASNGTAKGRAANRRIDVYIEN